MVRSERCQNYQAGEPILRPSYRDVLISCTQLYKHHIRHCQSVTKHQTDVICLMCDVARKPRGGGEGKLDQNLPIGSAIFHILGVFLTSCTCIVKSRKRGCFHKSTTKSGSGR